ncbi:phosphotransferase, partial [Candidatus Pacearchaeota archaeon]|nr:phosphotransferase [Candidatus Pacearchaeota archaeon]
MVEWNRNISKTYEISGKKIVSKKHQKRIFLRREQFFYDLFQRNPLIKTPEIYNIDGLNFQTCFIESEKKDIFQIPKDWAGVHSYFMKNPVEEDRLMINHDIGEVSAYVLGNIEIFGELGLVVRDRMSNVRINRNLKTILHGDLQQKNMVTFQNNNYYFDFELGGLGHPARDVASMIISNPNKKRELLAIYARHANFNYSGFEEDVDTWLMARAAQLYVIFNKREGTDEQKKTIKTKLSKIIKE